MRDWLISRQRYWGAPIPVIYCDRCGIVPVPEEALPVLLPDVERYEPAGTGASPLAAIPGFVATTCPRCAGPARRETDTLDGFADSNWYFLRFADPQYPVGPWNPRAVDYWLPVDWYVGGAEHAVMHLLYARFFTKVLFDEGLTSFSEPFARLRNQGSMLSPVDGMRMSKSRGNVVTPDEVVARYGADALRVYVLFIGPFDQDTIWHPEGIAGAARFVRRLFGLVARAADAPRREQEPDGRETILARLHRLVKMTGEAIEGFRFNVLVAELMAFLNDAERWEPLWRGTTVWREVVETFVRLSAPTTPFLAEEAWSRLGHHESIHRTSWPTYDPALAAGREYIVAVQVDGRTRDRITAAKQADREELIRLALARERIRRAIGGRTIKNVIVVPGRVVNLVTD
jgi:leucyl-tRNA synthetase